MESLNLDYNHFEHVPSCIGCLSALTFLSFNHNRLSDACLESLRADRNILSQLAVLRLGSNRLSSIEKLQLHRYPKLKSLFLHNNFISAVSNGLHSLWALKELVLDRNFIRQLHAHNFIDQINSLQELRLDHNLLDSISFVQDLTSLRSLHVSQNRLSHVIHLESLSTLTSLLEISVRRNHLCRKRIYRELALAKCPSLQIIDSRPISSIEQTLAATLSTPSTVLSVLSRTNAL